MNTVIQDLQKWTKEFEENASYYQGDYMRGMFHILNGINSQLDRWKNKEKQQIIEAFETGDFENTKVYTSEQYYNETYGK